MTKYPKCRKCGIAVHPGLTKLESRPTVLKTELFGRSYGDARN
jgi:hypothetical protein